MNKYSVPDSLQKKYETVLENSKYRTKFSAYTSFSIFLICFIFSTIGFYLSKIDLITASIIFSASLIIGAGTGLFFLRETSKINSDLKEKNIVELSGTPENISIYNGKRIMTRFTLEGNKYTLPVKLENVRTLNIITAFNSKIIIEWKQF